MEKRIDWWNLIFIFIFVGLTYCAYRLVLGAGNVPQSVPLIDAVLMAFATFRLTRLATYDAITEWFRNFFADARPHTLFGTIKTLVNCPWCVGLWFALIVATAYFVWPLSWFFIFVLALGGVATLVQLLANLLGWSAEYKKQKVLDD